MQVPLKCERATCPCEETPVLRSGKRYCSDECADREATGKAEPDCSCGHPDCAAG